MMHGHTYIKLFKLLRSSWFR